MDPTCITSHYTHRVLVCCISCLPCGVLSCYTKIVWNWLHVLIVCSSIAFLMDRCVSSSTSSIVWHVHRFWLHTFCNSQLIHLFFHTLLISDFFLLHAHFLFVLLPLLLINLSLQLSLHCLLLHFSLILHDKLLITTLPKNVAVSLKFQINSVVEDSSSCFHVWKVLLSNWSIEMLVSVAVLCLLRLLVNIECFVVRYLVEAWRSIELTTTLEIVLASLRLSHVLRMASVVLRVLRVDWLLSVICAIWLSIVRTVWLCAVFVLKMSSKAWSFCFPPFFFLPQVISFFDLFLKLFCKVLLLLSFLCHLMLVVISRILDQALTPNNGVLMIISLCISIDCQGWVGYGLDTNRTSSELVSRSLACWHDGFLLRKTAGL